jgi:hypothetical protein
MFEMTVLLPRRGTGLVTGRAGPRRAGVPRTEEERLARHSGLVQSKYVPRWQRIHVHSTGQQRVMYSELQERMVVYTRCQAHQAVDFFTYDLDLLKQAYNQELTNQGVDAFVDQVKELRGTFQSNIITDMWVATEGQISAAIVSLIILILKLVAIAVATLVILSAAASFIEVVLPKSKFYAPDGKEFDSLSEYITYMQNVYNPSQAKPYTCMYCGQGFATAEERDAHQATCPWKSGPPSAGGGFENLIVVGLIAVVVIVVVPPIIGLVKGQ